MTAIMAMFSPMNTATGLPVVIRLTSANDSRCCSLNGVSWIPGLLTKGSLSLTLFANDGNMSGTVTTGVGGIVASLPAMSAYNPASLMWNDQPVTLWSGKIGDPWSSYTQIFTGLILGFSTTAGKASIALRINDAFLDQPVLTSLYQGTGGAEGTAALMGSPKPLCIGSPQMLEPVLIDAVNNIYQFSGYGPVQGVTTVYDRLSRFPASVGDSATYTALVAAVVPPGFFGTCLASGMIKIGAPPAGPLTVSVQGDNSGGWVRKPGAVIKRLCAIAGFTTQVNTASLTSLDAAMPYPISLFVNSQTTLRALVASIAGSFNSAFGVDWTGRLFVSRPVIAATPALVLNTNGASLPQVANVAMLATAIPYWRIQQEAARAWRVHATNEIAYGDTLVPLGDYNGATTYRPGNIVNYLGVQYLYTNPTPTSGNVPPNSAFWTLFEGAPQYSEIGGNDKPVTYLIAAQGYSASGAPRGPGLYNGDGSAIQTGAWRSYVVNTYASGVWTSRGFDVFGGGGIIWPGTSGAAQNNATAMAAYLNALANGVPIVIYTYDEPNANRLSAGLDTAMYRCGASPATYGNSSTFLPRSAYVLIGQAGVGSGGGTEYNSADNGVNAWINVSATMINGVFQLGGSTPISSGVPGNSLYEWTAYADDITGATGFTTGAPNGRRYQGTSYNNASATESSTPTDYAWSLYTGPSGNFGLVPRGCSLRGNVVTKNNGSASWGDCDCFSDTSFANGSYVSFSNDGSSELMVGLTHDPTYDENYDNIDYAFYCRPGGTYWDIRNRGATIFPGGSWSAATKFLVQYDGKGVVRYYVDGGYVYGQNVAAAQTLYLDSAILSNGGNWTLLGYGPGSASGVDGATGPVGSPGAPSTVPGPVGPQGPAGAAAPPASQTVGAGGAVQRYLSAGQSWPVSGGYGTTGANTGNGTVHGTLIANGTVFATGGGTFMGPGEPGQDLVSGTFTNGSTAQLVSFSIGHTGGTGLVVDTSQTFCTA